MEICLTTSDSNQDVMMDMGELLDGAANLNPLKKGEIARGVVMRVDSNGIYLSFGQKSEGLVPMDEMKSVKSPKVVSKSTFGTDSCYFLYF